MQQCAVYRYEDLGNLHKSLYSAIHQQMILKLTEDFQKNFMILSSKMSRQNSVLRSVLEWMCSKKINAVMYSQLLCCSSEPWKHQLSVAWQSMWQIDYEVLLKKEQRNRKYHAALMQMHDMPFPFPLYVIFEKLYYNVQRNKRRKYADQNHIYYDNCRPFLVQKAEWRVKHHE